MREISFHLNSNSHLTLQGQIRYFLIEAIAKQQLPMGTKLPSTRALAKQLRVSRNTVILAYQSLEADGILESLSQTGYRVTQDNLIVEKLAHQQDVPTDSAGIDWQNRLNSNILALNQIAINKPENWRDYPYPFLYGQSDMSLFPFSDWRNCMRQAMTRKLTEKWTDDLLANDDRELIQQIRERLLLARGIQVEKEQILITAGAQNAIFFASYLLTNRSSILAMEDPGYTDTRHLFSWLAKNTDYNQVKFLPFSAQQYPDGLDADQIGKVSLLYVTPSHQVPTGVTMSLENRKKLLAWADAEDAIIIEDDYDFEINHQRPVIPSLKSMDRSGRVIYVGSFSKSVMPGLRLGFLVGAPEFIEEARKLKRLCLRHTPGNNQRALALFLTLGYYDVHYQRLKRVYLKRSAMMGEILQNNLHGMNSGKDWFIRPQQGGMSYWLQMPKNIDSRALAQSCMAQGILIEPGGVFFQNSADNHHHIRLGFSSINENDIEAGIVRFFDVGASLR